METVCLRSSGRLFFCSEFSVLLTIFLSDYNKIQDNNITVTKNERRNKMKMMSVVKGVAAGTAVGAAAYVISSASRKQRNSLKRNAGRTIRSFMTVLGDISEML